MRKFENFVTRKDCKEKRLTSEKFKALVDSEVTATLVGEALNNDRLMKFYANKDQKLIKRVFSWLSERVKRLRDKSPDKVEKYEALMAAEEMTQVFSSLLVMPGESGGVEGAKYSFDGTPEQIAKWEKPITLQDVEALRSIGKKSINKFTSEEIKIAQKWAHKFYKEFGAKSPFFRAWFGEWRTYDNTKIEFVDQKIDNRKDVINNDTNWKIQTSKKVHKETTHHSGSPEVNAVKYLPYIDDITKKDVLLDSVISNKDNPNSLMFHTMYAYTEVMGYPALLKLKVEELFYYNKDGSGEITRDYILQNIEEETLSKRNRLSRSNHSDRVPSTISISDLYELVKIFDKDFVPAPEVSEYVLNEDGTPKVLYHGTNAEYYSINNSINNFP